MPMFEIEIADGPDVNEERCKKLYSSIAEKNF